MDVHNIVLLLACSICVGCRQQVLISTAILQPSPDAEIKNSLKGIKAAAIPQAAANPQALAAKNPLCVSKAADGSCHLYKQFAFFLLALTSSATAFNLSGFRATSAFIANPTNPCPISVTLDTHKRSDYHSQMMSSSETEDQNLDAGDAEMRAKSSARAQFAAAVKRDSSTPFELAMLLACEERTAEEPITILDEVDLQIEELTAAARTRLSLASLLGHDKDDPKAVVSSVSSTLFGTGSAEDDDKAFFEGNDPNYYDARNSFVDVVLQRRLGIPITLSLVHAEICKRLGCSMVGLNAPGHLLIAPSDKTLPFVVDPFNGGVLLSIEDASQMVAANRGGLSLEQGKIMLDMLRNRPMTGHMWCARMLRNLRMIYADANDVVRTLGVAERLRMVGQARPETSSHTEQLECAVQMVYCIFMLKWEARRGQARELLAGVLENDELSQVARQQLQGLLMDEWFRND